MSDTPTQYERPTTDLGSAHRSITPSILYFGTPVGVISTLNESDSTNLAPISSYWALGDLLVIGLAATGHTVANLRRHPELVLNLCSVSQWEAVERLGRLTGAHPVPRQKPSGTQFAADKFGAAGWTPLASTSVIPERVTELPVHLEAAVTGIRDEADQLAVVFARCQAVHVLDELTVAGTSHIDPGKWNPLIYNFRHYFGLGTRLGIAARAEVRAAGRCEVEA
ncbi:flavin reductase family protein [Glutamicibacter sp. X7]